MQLAPPTLNNDAPAQTILLVDDHASYRAVVRTALGSFLPQFGVLDAESITTAMQVIKDKAPDVVVADMTLPDGSAMDLVKQAGPYFKHGSRIIVISSHAKEEMLPVLSHDDIHGYVSKEDGVMVLARRILDVTRDEGRTKRGGLFESHAFDT